MSKVSFYRKYRPNSFEEVVGQKNIVTILQNAIAHDKVGHAYIFNGPRGTGKTSIAKIFARTVNCKCDENNFCQLCQKMNDKIEVPDIWEIDAASNNGVDEVRSIIENVDFLPLELDYKIYIIDEVHMLSKAAFNALLKTLEEPPKHVIFILATTEIHKVPLTILSRCQRFDFSRLEVLEMQEKMQSILGLEGISYDEEAVKKIASLADGGMRDSLSLLEKVCVFADQIDVDTVNQALSLAHESTMQKLLDALLTNDAKTVATTWHEITMTGCDQTKFITSFQYYIKDLLIDGESQADKQMYLNILMKLTTLANELNFTKNYSLIIEIYLIDIALGLNQTQVVSQAPVVNQKPRQVEAKPQVNLKELEQKTQMLQNQLKQEESFDDIKIEQPIIREPVKQQVEEPIVQKPVEQPVKDVVEPEVVINDSRPTQTSDSSSLFNDLMGDLVTERADELVILEDEEQEVDEQPLDYDAILGDNEVEIVEQEVVAKSELNVTIVDVLDKATKEDKKLILDRFGDIKRLVEGSEKFGLAKFFDVAEVKAASPIGFVMTVDQGLQPSYAKRLDELSDYIYQSTKINGKIFILDESMWLETRAKYVASKKENMGTDIYSLACKTFGESRVNKV